MQSGVKAQTKDVIAPPKKTIPMAEAVNAANLARTTRMNFGPGMSDLIRLKNVGASGATSCLYPPGTKKPSMPYPD